MLLNPTAHASAQPETLLNSRPPLRLAIRVHAMFFVARVTPWLVVQRRELDAWLDPATGRSFSMRGSRNVARWLSGLRDLSWVDVRDPAGRLMRRSAFATVGGGADVYAAISPTPSGMLNVLVLASAQPQHPAASEAA